MRRGFNVLRLLICLAILAVLAGLLVPGVMNIRRAALRMSCQNNLKQLGLAIHSYQDTFQHFPPGTLPNPTLLPEDRFGLWLVVLPYTESQPLYAALARTERWDSPKNVEVMGNYLGRLYRCPEWTYQYGNSSGANAAVGHHSVTNYLGVAGLGADAATRPADAPAIGLFGYDRTLKMEDVTDGLENTAMLIETGRDLGPWVRGGPSTVRSIDPTVEPLQGDGAPFGGTHFSEKVFFRGTFANGYHVLLGDASVRYVKGTLDHGVLAALATIAGKEDLPPDQ